MATVLLLVIYIAFIGLGLPDSLLGSAWPLMHLDFGVPVEVAGVVSVVTTIGTVISSFFSDRVIKRFGTASVTTCSVALTAAALLGIRFSGNYLFVVLLSIPLGLGGGTIDSALNNFVALHYSASHMNWLHCFWGIGATAGPLIMSRYLAVNNWRGAYQAIALILLAVAALLLLTRKLWNRDRQGNGGEESQQMLISKRALIQKPGVLMACLAFFIYCGVEYTTGLWACSYFVEYRGLSPDAAASWGAMYYFGITFGRLISGFLSLKLRDRQLLILGLLLMAAGLGILLLPLPGSASLLGLILLGIGSGPIFPGMLDMTPALFGTECSQGVMGMQIASAYVGSSLFPPLLGLLTGWFGMGLWTWYLLILTALLAVCVVRTYTEKQK